MPINDLGSLSICLHNIYVLYIVERKLTMRDYREVGSRVMPML